MRPSRQIINSFFYDIKEDFILNTLYVLRFIIKVDEHKSHIEKILSLGIQKSTMDELYRATEEEIQHYENLSNNDEKYIMTEITTGKAIYGIKDTPVIWCFIAIYWSYNFKSKDHNTILETYNSRVGDIALKFLLYFLKMKHKEAYTVCTAHKDSFYEDLSARLVRIIDILPVMESQNSEHLKKLYLPTDQSDLALNFLKVQIENPWEQDVFSVIENPETGKNVIRYSHIDENLSFLITPSRMTKEGAFRDLDKTYNQLMQLYHLDDAKSRTRYGRISRNKHSKNTNIPITHPLEVDLIFDELMVTEALTPEEKIESKAKSKVYHRTMKDPSTIDDENTKDTNNYVVPNAWKQHKQNIAFSAALSKQKMLLASDYDIPPFQHLKSFILSLETKTDMKIFTSFFILNIVLGCKIEDLIFLLQENKEGSMKFKNSIVTVSLDTSIFADNHSKLLLQNDDKLSFNIPITMQMLIVSAKKTFQQKDFDKEVFLESYKQFIKDSIKNFPKRIIIKWKHLYRYLAQYSQENAKDVLTTKFATAAYSQNDTAKLAYTSSRTNATEHSQLIKEYWNKLGLDEAASEILDIPNSFVSDISSISTKEYSGSSQVIETNNASMFFESLRQNIYDYRHNNDDLYFNLVTIYIRYAMSLLAGTRPFKESANFSSYNEKSGIWMISEKAQDIASGTRLVPICYTMNKLIIGYKELLTHRGLENNFYLIINEHPVLFSSYEAYKYLQNAQSLNDCEVLEEYVKNVPLNSGRHLFTQKAIDALTNAYYISTYLGHYSAGEEYFGIYSTLNVSDYFKTITNITSQIAREYGIKEL